MTGSREGQRPGSAWLSGLVVGFAAGVATLEVPVVGWAIVVAFVILAARSHRAAAAGGMLLLGMGLAWMSLIISSGVIPELIGWSLTAIGMAIAGVAILAVGHVRER